MPIPTPHSNSPRQRLAQLKTERRQVARKADDSNRDLLGRLAARKRLAEIDREIEQADREWADGLTSLVETAAADLRFAPGSPAESDRLDVLAAKVARQTGEPQRSARERGWI